MVARFTVIRRPRRARNQRGAVAVEFALIMPMLCLLVFGIIEFGFMLNRDMIVGNASRDGARAASLGDTYADIRAGIASELAASGVPTTVATGTTITIDCRTPDGLACNATSTTYDAAAVSGSTAIINVEYDHTLITPFISSILGDVVTLEQSTQMRVE
jgi:Flp pilus assembly protein TadG